MRQTLHRILPLLAGLSYLACACSGGSTAPVATSAATDMAPDTLVAKIGDQKISLAELDERLAGQLKDLEEQRYQIRRQGLDQLVNQTLVKEAAKQRNLTEEQYLKEEVEAKVTPPSEATIAEFFKQNSAQLPPGAKLADFKDRIVSFLSNQSSSTRAKEVFAELRKNTPVEMLLAPPPKPRVEVEAKGPSRGPANAKVTVVEFSDFECPYCQAGHDVMEKVMKKYDGKIRMVFRHFPLTFHAHAKKAAEASLCADAQGKFWPYHDALFADQKKLDIDGLKASAATLGLNADAFAKCLDSGEQAKVLDADMKAAEKAGVSGTPAFFINGILLSGAQKMEEFERVIDQELAAK